VVEIKRKKGETFESFYRRFSKRLQQSGKLFLARKIRFHERPKSKTQRRKATLFKLVERAKKELGEKTGRIKEDQEKRGYYKK
jgi:ribosomal protein S21